MTNEWTLDEEAAALHQRFDDLKKAGGGQAEFARRWGIPGGASMVSQHIKSRRPISIEAAIAYAEGFGCTVSEISPRLGKTLNRANSEQKPAPAIESIAPGAINISANRRAALNPVEVVNALCALLAEVDPNTLTTVTAMLGDLARNPGNTKLAGLLSDALTPEAFAQQNQRAG